MLKPPDALPNLLDIALGIVNGEKPVSATCDAALKHLVSLSNNLPKNDGKVIFQVQEGSETFFDLGTAQTQSLVHLVFGPVPAM